MKQNGPANRSLRQKLFLAIDRWFRLFNSCLKNFHKYVRVWVHKHSVCSEKHMVETFKSLDKSGDKLPKTDLFHFSNHTKEFLSTYIFIETIRWFERMLSKKLKHLFKNATFKKFLTTSTKYLLIYSFLFDHFYIFAKRFYIKETFFEETLIFSLNYY